MTQALGLPDGIRPIWLEGVVVSEYEKDTLPLLFASDEVFNEYYDALSAKNPAFTQPLDMIRIRNKRARDQRFEGYWQDCLITLSQCLHLRRCIFDDTDFQYCAAVKHYILSVLNFATFLLKESSSSPGSSKEGVIAKSFQLFKQAEGITQQVDCHHHRAFFKATVASNLGNYFYKRKKVKAAGQQAVMSLKHWSKAKVNFASSFFISRHAIALCFCGRWVEAAKSLTAAVRSEESQESSTTHPTPEAYQNAPVRFNVQLLANPMPICDATQLVLFHNLSVTMIALRRNKEAAYWCQRAMDTANSNSQHLAASHPWVKAIKECQAFCSQMSYAHLFQKYRMKASDTHIPEFQKMQKIISETRTMPIFNSLLQLHKQQLKDEKEAKRQEEEAKEDYRKELEEKAAINKKTRKAAIEYGVRGKSSSRKRPPMSALRMYVRQTSYQQFVDSFVSKEDSKREQLALPPPPTDEFSQISSRKREELNSARLTDANLQSGTSVDSYSEGYGSPRK